MTTLRGNTNDSFPFCSWIEENIKGLRNRIWLVPESMSHGLMFGGLRVLSLDNGSRTVFPLFVWSCCIGDLGAKFACMRQTPLSFLSFLPNVVSRGLICAGRRIPDPSPFLPLHHIDQSGGAAFLRSSSLGCVIASLLQNPGSR